MATRSPVLDQINVVVGDMAASTEFYRRLGLEIPDSHPGWGKHHVEADLPDGLDMDLDSPVFAQQWNQGWARNRKGLVIGFRLESRDDVDARYPELTEAGYKGLQPPYDAFWGARYAVIEDPDGNAVGMMSPSDPRHQRPPPDPNNLG